MQNLRGLNNAVEVFYVRHTTLQPTVVSSMCVTLASFFIAHMSRSACQTTVRQRASGEGTTCYMRMYFVCTRHSKKIQQAFRVPTPRALGIDRRDRRNPSAPTAADNTEYTLHTTAEELSCAHTPFCIVTFFSNK